MTVRITAFEGSASGRHVASWGAAAVEVNGTTKNSVTGALVAETHLRALISEGRVAAIPPIVINDEEEVNPIVVTRLDKGSIAGPCISELRRHESLGQSEDASSVYLAFRDRQALRIAAEAAVNRLLAVILDAWTSSRDEVKVLIHLGLTLLNDHPELNAVWSAFADTDGVRRIARRHAASWSGGVARFDAMSAGLAALRQGDLVTLKFSGGPATRGRLPMGVHAVAAVAFDNVFSFEAANVCRSQPFVGDVPDLVFEERQAASVDWHFRTTDDDGIRSQLARTLTWLRIQQTIAEGATNVGDPVVREAYARLARPTADVTLTLEHAGSVVHAPSVIRRAELLWCKQLARSETFNVRPGTRVKRFLQLTGSGWAIDYRTWFRSVLFGDLAWAPSGNGDSSKEFARTTFNTTIQGIFLGPLEYEIDHDPRRAEAQSHGQPTTWLYWHDQIADTFRRGFHAGHWVSITSERGELALTISSAPPFKPA